MQVVGGGRGLGGEPMEVIEVDRAISAGAHLAAVAQGESRRVSRAAMEVLEVATMA